MDKKAEEARSKQIVPTDYSTNQMAKTPSVSVTSLEQRRTPPAGVPTQVEQQPSMGTTSANAAINGANRALQSLHAFEFKGPKAPYGKGILHAEASLSRNYRPMSTQAGIPAPQGIVLQRTVR